MDQPKPISTRIAAGTLNGDPSQWAGKSVLSVRSFASRGEKAMRFFRHAFVVPIALIALALMSSPASALTPTQLSVGHTQLGLYGLSVSVRIKFTCDPSLNVAF